MDKNNKTKIYILLGLCLIIILGLWLYSLKLNLSALKNNDTSKDTGAKSLINTIVDIFKAHPLTEPEEKVTTPVEELTNKIAEEIKNQNNSISTADWLTYRNEELGLEFKYPKEWKVTNSTSKEETKINLQKYFNSVYQNQNINEICVMNFKASTDNNTSTDLDFKDFIANGTIKSIIKIDNIESNYLKLNKKTSDELTFYEGFGIFEDHISFSHNNTYYQLIRVRDRAEATEEIQNSCSNTFKQILSTFKFLK